MFAKASILLALLSALAQVAIATPPACVIGAISTASNPRDIQSICSSPDNVKTYLSQKCGSNQQIAVNYFSGVCSDAGVSVSTDLPSSSSKSVPSSTGSLSTGAPSASSTSGANDSVSSSTDSSGSSSTTSGSSSSPTGSSGTSVVVVGATASVPATSASASAHQGAAGRVRMDTAGLFAVGALGAMFAL